MRSFVLICAACAGSALASSMFFSVVSEVESDQVTSLSTLPKEWLLLICTYSTQGDWGG